MAKDVEINIENKRDPYTVLTPNLEPKPQITPDGKVILETFIPTVEQQPETPPDPPKRNAGHTFPPHDTGEYIYTLTEDGSGYHVRVADPTKSNYGPFLTEYQGKPIVSMQGMFKGCTNLKSIHDIENFTIPATVKDVSEIFADCTSLKDISKFPPIAHVEITTNMFENCPSIEYLDIVKLMSKTHSIQQQYDSLKDGLTTASFHKENTIKNPASKDKSPLANFAENFKNDFAKNQEEKIDIIDNSQIDYLNVKDQLFPAGDDILNNSGIDIPDESNKNISPIIDDRNTNEECL